MEKLDFKLHAPRNSVAGGCESMHQLCDAINFLGHHASIVYLPKGGDFVKPSKFDCYFSHDNTQVGTSPINVFGELDTKNVSLSTDVIYWLSIDNYFRQKDKYSKFRNLLRRYKSLIKNRKQISSLRHAKHLFQSKYAEEFLAQYSFKGFYIGDFINYSVDHSEIGGKEPIICYNPAKGQQYTSKIIESDIPFTFRPLVGLSEIQMREELKKSMVYIDFGNHPGRDRIPREAAKCGCVIITGRRGSAGNSKDIGIDEIYKLNEKDDNFQIRFRELVLDIYKNPDHHLKKMESYRSSLRNDKELFLNNVSLWINSYF